MSAAPDEDAPEGNAPDQPAPQGIGDGVSNENGDAVPGSGADAGAGDDAEEQGPERRCIATGERRPKAQLLRFVVSPDGEVVPDLTHCLPGRGIWLSARRDVVNTAVVKRLFAKAARRQVSVAPDLADRIEALLARRCLDAVGLARRAGQAICGAEKVRAEVLARRAALLVEARDAAQAGRGRMRALASALPVIELFDGAELGSVFGRDAAVHVCLSSGKLARRLLDEAVMLAGFRDGEVNIVSAARDEVRT